MIKQFLLALAVTTALFAGAIRLPAQTCILSSSASETACVPGCCANKMCCAVSVENTRPPSPPLSKGGVAQDVTPAMGLVPTKLLAPQRIAVATAWLHATHLAPSRQALFCTFLI